MDQPGERPAARTARHSFQQPLRSTEAWIFGLFFAAATAGLLELMMREKAGTARPDYFKLMPPQPRTE